MAASLLLDSGRRTLSDGIVVVALGFREERVMRAVARGGGAAVGRESILREAWDDDDGTDVNLEVNIWKLRTKMRTAGFCQIIRTIARFGYCADGIRIAGAEPLLLTTPQRHDLRTLLNTHPNEALAHRVGIAVGIVA